jgi:cell division protein FtsB
MNKVTYAEFNREKPLRSVPRLPSVPSTPIKTRRRWRFRAHSPLLLVLGILITFALFRLLLWPLVSGVYMYCAKAIEIQSLKAQSMAITEQLKTMRKDLTYMRTDSYVEERGHQLGYIKPNEAQMMVVQPSKDGQPYQPKKKKPVQITD